MFSTNSGPDIYALLFLLLLPGTRQKSKYTLHHRAVDVCSGSEVREPKFFLRLLTRGTLCISPTQNNADDKTNKQTEHKRTLELGLHVVVGVVRKVLRTLKLGLNIVRGG